MIQITGSIHRRMRRAGLEVEPGRFETGPGETSALRCGRAIDQYAAPVRRECLFREGGGAFRAFWAGGGKMDSRLVLRKSGTGST